MSVINQMLKDLEQRAPEQGQAPVQVAHPKKASTLKIVLLSAFVLLSLNAIGFYIWSLQERVAESESKLQKTVDAENEIIEQVLANKPVKTKEIVNQENQQEVEAITETNVLNQVKKTQEPNNLEQNIAINKTVESEPPQQSNEELNLRISAAKNQPIPIDRITKPSTTQNSESSKMSISRRQLTSKELVEQKLAKAEQSININEIAKAERLFEDILIIDPDHKQARKKLAALWFGRKSYQQAVNLLSQGISRDKQDGELRLMQARIHLKQGQPESAYNTLKPLVSFEQEEYQVMLANVAQQIEQYPSAINAYKVLIKMQPYSGRWHLGLAIVYDKSSQFSLAVNEYAIALTKTDLSASSAKFAQQRMQALGE